MYKVGEYIVHGRQGVCKVDDITELDIRDAKKSLYYVLLPVKNMDSKVYYPVDGNKVITREVISKDEATDILDYVQHVSLDVIENDRQREEKYKRVLSSCDCKEIACMVKAVSERNKKREAQGKRTTYVDDKYLKEAKDFVIAEMSIALDIPKNDVEGRIKKYFVD